jgi:hypothetical protein
VAYLFIIIFLQTALSSSQILKKINIA